MAAMAERPQKIAMVIPIDNSAACPLLNYIRSGMKTAEGYKNDPKYHKLKVGDLITFKASKTDFLTVRITTVTKYRSLREYLTKETLKKTIPSCKTYEHAEAIYNQWSSEEERSQLCSQTGCGFIGIGFTLI